MAKVQTKLLTLRIVTGPFRGNVEVVPRICCDSSGNSDLPFILRRHQFPVRYAWAITINKSQGQTIPARLGIYLPTPVFSHGQLYVALSRATSFAAARVLAADHEDKQRAPQLNPNNSCIKTLNIVDRALLSASRTITSVTGDGFVAAGSSTSMRECAESKCPPSLLRFSADTNPCGIMALATNVLPASDTGHANESLPSDEPLPWSSLSHHRGMCFSDLPSASVARSPRATETVPSSCNFGLSDAPTAWSNTYFELQMEAHCGMHALNNLIGGPQFTQTDLQEATEQVLAETADSISAHVAPGGWYSHSVLARVLQNTIPPKWSLRLNALSQSELLDFCSSPIMAGALLNEDNQHWVAIVRHADCLWHVDSCKLPRRLRQTDLRNLLGRFPNTFPLLLTEYPE